MDVTIPVQWIDQETCGTDAEGLENQTWELIASVCRAVCKWSACTLEGERK